jgi:hypothetical protein
MLYDQDAGRGRASGDLEDRVAGVTPAFKVEGELVRLMIRSATSRVVRWKVRFKE